jgi:hypothetical protein
MLAGTKHSSLFVMEEKKSFIKFTAGGNVEKLVSYDFS